MRRNRRNCTSPTNITYFDHTFHVVTHVRSMFSRSDILTVSPVYYLREWSTDCCADSNAFQTQLFLFSLAANVDCRWHGTHTARGDTTVYDSWILDLHFFFQLLFSTFVSAFGSISAKTCRFSVNLKGDSIFSCFLKPLFIFLANGYNNGHGFFFVCFFFSTIVSGAWDRISNSFIYKTRP